MISKNQYRVTDADYVEVNIESSVIPSLSKNPNNILYLSVEEPLNLIGSSKTYTRLSDIETDFGTNSTVYEKATYLFNERPYSFRDGNGSLTIAPLQNPVSATRGYTKTVDINSTKLTALRLVEDGRIRITVDGDNFDLEDLDFTKLSTNDATARNELAIIFENSLNGSTFITVEGEKLVFTSKSFGENSSVVLAVLSGTGTNLASSTYFDTANQDDGEGTDYEGETLQEAYIRLQDSFTFPIQSVITDANFEVDALVSFSIYAGTVRKFLFYHEISSFNDASVIESDLTALKHSYGRFIFYQNLDIASNVKFAWVSRLNATKYFTGLQVVMERQQLKTIPLGDSLSKATIDALHSQGLDVYGTYDNTGRLLTHSNPLIGETTSFKNRLAFILEIQKSVGNFLNAGVVRPRNNSTLAQMVANITTEVLIPARDVSRILSTGRSWAGVVPEEALELTTEANFKAQIERQGFFIQSYPFTPSTPLDETPPIFFAYKEGGRIRSIVINGVQEA